MRISISVTDGTGTERARADGEDEAVLVHAPAYREGDAVAVETEADAAFVVVQMDDAMLPALLFTTGSISLPIPFGAAREPYSPRAFSGTMHRLHARSARPDEIAARRNLCLNPYDHAASRGTYPHVTASAETVGNPQFLVRNAIDGEKASRGHGPWPHASWGINRDPNASLTVDFGRPVEVDEAVIYLRADFPHDAWWREATLAFSDGSRETFALVRSGLAQPVVFAPRVVTSVRLCGLVKADDPSPFPALTQIEIWGHDI